MVLIEFLIKTLRTSTTLYGLIVARTLAGQVQIASICHCQRGLHDIFRCCLSITINSTRMTFSRGAQMVMKDLCSSAEVDSQRQKLDGDERMV